jgi:hypothetical protein
MTNDSNQGRNPFGVMDVPDPFGRDVQDFAAGATLEGGQDDDNARNWANAHDDSHNDSIDGDWSSRWNGGADPTIPGDTRDRWKQGVGKVKAVGERVYLQFTWADGVRKGLIEARREGTDRLVGKYINLTDPSVVRPWIGLIVSNQRIDGRWTSGRLDFRR